MTLGGSPPVVVREEARPEWLRMLRRIDEVINAGRGVPCVADPEPFTSDVRYERLEAADACLACPVLLECATFALAHDEATWVWAGVDLTPDRGARPALVRAQLAARATPQPIDAL